MKIYLEGTLAQLQGDVTLTGMTHENLDSLVESLRTIESGGIRKIRIDCGSVRAADISGLQLLDVWMRCARIRGVEPELVNLPDSLRQSMQSMGYRYCFTETSTHQ